MQQELKNQCYLLSLEGYTSRQIANKLNLDHSTVSRAISSITKGNDYQLAVRGCSKLIQEYARYQDYARKKINELAEIIPEDNSERIAIIREQNNIFKDLLTTGASGEFVHSINKIRDRISQLEHKE